MLSPGGKFYSYFIHISPSFLHKMQSTLPMLPYLVSPVQFVSDDFKIKLPKECLNVPTSALQLHGILLSG